MYSNKSKLPPGEDPCNPLYWYPRNIPEYCKFANTVRQASSEEPPAANPLPPAPSMLIPMPPHPLSLLPPPVPILPPPLPILPSAPLIAGPSPIIAGSSSLFPAPRSASVISISSNPYPYSHENPISAYNSLPYQNSFPYYPSLQRSPTGFVPGMHGLVTRDGGINIMPFSDIYADMLEKHKNKMIRRKLHKILDKYNSGPYYRDHRRIRKYEKYFKDYR
ncbi:jg22408 [Pararge aegeria aegeria]|uniref:Jg22408 protein n=1 Tax=Pararge aegeria aegeria TaxID=348720 RepID=A0A8S4QLJ2_9NEOP|nr:jg22408 [Pararge aegeria aegeria]